MTTQYYSGPTYGGRLFSFLLALAMGAAGLAIFIRHATTGTAGRVVALITGRAAGMGPSVPAVVEKLHRLGRLQTAVYSQDTVVEGNPSAPTRHTPGDPLLLVVHGESIAGIDLVQLKPEDVRIDSNGHGIHVTLPATVLDCAGRPAHTGLLAHGRDAGTGGPVPGTRPTRQGAGPATAGSADGRHPGRREQERTRAGDRADGCARLPASRRPVRERTSAGSPSGTLQSISLPAHTSLAVSCRHEVPPKTRLLQAFVPRL